MIGAYKQSKFLAELEVKRLVDEAKGPGGHCDSQRRLSGPVMSSRPRPGEWLSKPPQAGCLLT